MRMLAAQPAAVSGLALVVSSVLILRVLFRIFSAVR